MDYAGIRHEADKQWHVVRVRANAERQVARSLSCRDIEVFLPLQKHPGKNKNGGVVERPLFPGYVFAGFNSRVTLPVVACPGVVHILCRGNIPEVVDPSEMFALQAVACRAHTLLPLPSFDCGEKVRIRQGPLADVEGIVLRDEGRSRLIVSVSLLQRSVVAEVDRDWLEKAEPAPLVNRARMMTSSPVMPFKD
jgi:transcription antitermination factor NusG